MCGKDGWMDGWMHGEFGGVSVSVTGPLLLILIRV